jgi:hypothetical protein
MSRAEPEPREPLLGGKQAVVLPALPPPLEIRERKKEARRIRVAEPVLQRGRRAFNDLQRQRLIEVHGVGGLVVSVHDEVISQAADLPGCQPEALRGHDFLADA